MNPNRSPSPVQQNALPETDNDVTSLFSHFSGFAAKAKYRDFVRENAAEHAAFRWPLVVEIEQLQDQTRTDRGGKPR